MLKRSRLIAIAILLLVVAFGIIIFIAGFYIVGFFMALLSIGGSCIYLGCVDAEEIIDNRDNQPVTTDKA
ncbi:MAG: hypothetical protein MJK10_19190 [Pseudomonadales bacterium]|nr:hypothetical protein [Pseudomonadales bacterium]NRA15259.1 hypothetical protein [Oceanospirillaceae bacterium]